METVELNVTGMTCGGCAKSIERALGDLNGVTAVQALYEQQRVIVQFEPNLTTVAALTEAIEDAGFDVA